MTQFSLKITVKSACGWCWLYFKDLLFSCFDFLFLFIVQVPCGWLSAGTLGDDASPLVASGRMWLGAPAAHGC